ncbi:histamine H1 receptor [Chanos chanos]|uniref:Muscarinic acetylcholine receptor n=1 Tax=Chanos chanos TaxID=29144 RepID=A0A6J2VQ38_CHACN|nr:histamine H1 receptor [Chanos chanos]
METTTVSYSIDGPLNESLHDQYGSSGIAHLNISVSFQYQMNNAILGMLLGTLSLLTVIMNILVLYAVKREKILHSVGNLYIVSLSLADLIVGATVMPLNLIYLLQEEWKLGRVLCQFWLVMDYVASTASIFSLFILCLDRYRSVCQPLNYLKYRTRGRATLMIAGAWLLSMTWIIPILGWRTFFHVDKKPEMENKCDTDFRFVTWFKVLTAVLNFYIPSLLMLWYYSRIFISVREHYRQWESLTSPVVSIDKNGTVPDKIQLRRPSDNPPYKDNLVLQTYSQNKTILDQYTLEQPYSSKDKNEEDNTELWSERMTKSCVHQDSFFNVSKRMKKPTGESEERSPTSQGDGSVMGTPLKESTLPLSFLQSDENTELKMFVSLSDCNVMVPNSVAHVCEIVPATNVHKYTTVLSNDDFRRSLASPWAEGTNPKLDTTNALTLKQTWQKFCAQSKQCVQNLRIHKERKAARQLGFIIAGFLVCWIPYFITFMVMAFCNDCVHHDLHMFTIWLGYVNSTLNPFIYPLCNENFKRVFKNYFHMNQ